jgi:16S rRNA processing protein RimM
MEKSGLPFLVTLGRIVRPHGMKGHVKVLPFIPNKQRLGELGMVWITNQAEEVLLKTTLKECSWLNQFALIKFDGVDSLEAADLLKNCWMGIPIAEVPPPPDGEYYSFQLIGLSVCDLNGNEIGRITDTEKYPASDVYVVQLTNGSSVLIPVSTEVIKKIDLEQSQVIIDMKVLEELL